MIRRPAIARPKSFRMVLHPVAPVAAVTVTGKETR